MKAVLLAAGKGTRIGHLTDGIPKSLLPFGDVTLLGHSLKLLSDVGIDSFVIVTGYERAAIRKAAEAAVSGASFEFVYNPFYDRTNVLYSFYLAMPWLLGDDFVYLHADTVFSQEVLRRLLEADTTHPIVFAVDDHPCEEEEMKVLVRDRRVTRVTKLMPGPDADGEFLGLARLDGSTIRRLMVESEKLFEAGELQAFFERAVQECIDDGTLSVGVCDVTGLPWQEVDFEQDYRDVLAKFGVTGAV